MCFIENNAYAVATPLRHACAVEDLYLRAASYGMKGYRIDGNDVVGIYGLLTVVSRDIRVGAGPCLIEARCYRRYHHAGNLPGSAFGYRTKEEEARSKDREVIATFPRALLDGRANVSADDIRGGVLPALRHRCLLNFEGEAEGKTTDEILQNIVETLPADVQMATA